MLPNLLTETQDWHDEARCTRYTSMGGSYLWISDEPEQIERAKELCLDCPVFSECGAWAKEHRTLICGVYAGVYYEHLSMPHTETRTCNMCFEDKPRQDFYPRQARCKKCYNAISLARQRKRREQASR